MCLVCMAGWTLFLGFSLSHGGLSCDKDTHSLCFQTNGNVLYHYPQIQCMHARYPGPPLTVYLRIQKLGYTIIMSQLFCGAHLSFIQHSSCPWFWLAELIVCVCASLCISGGFSVILFAGYVVMPLGGDKWPSWSCMSDALNRVINWFAKKNSFIQERNKSFFFINELLNHSLNCSV